MFTTDPDSLADSDLNPDPNPIHTHDGCCIDYSQSDVVVPGSVEGFSVNLTKETITVPGGYRIQAYSTDGGTKWKRITKAFDAKLLAKLLNKDLSLCLSDKVLDKKSKQPDEGARVVSFPQINKRPKLPKLTVNYAIRADLTGATPGQWVLAEKGGSDAVRKDIQIGVADAKKKNKVTDANHFGHFYPVNGVCVKALRTKPEKTAYFIRTAPVKDGSAYTAASKPKRISALSEQKKPVYKVKADKKTKGKTIKLKANTYSTMNYAVEHHPSKTVIDVKEYKGTVQIWTGATAKKPASAKQKLTL